MSNCLPSTAHCPPPPPPPCLPDSVAHGCPSHPHKGLAHYSCCAPVCEGYMPYTLYCSTPSASCMTGIAHVCVCVCVCVCWCAGAAQLCGCSWLPVAACNICSCSPGVYSISVLQNSVSVLLWTLMGHARWLSGAFRGPWQVGA